MSHRVQIRSCGVQHYKAGLLLQEEARQRVASSEWDGILLLLQHSPVITVGRSGGKENLIESIEGLKAREIEYVESARGGNITCHNPGQLVGYPVLNLSCWREDVHWYARQLEEVLIRTLKEYGVSAGRKAKYTGVWVGDQKIAAMGISVRRWITGHGFALNISNDLNLFRSIVPCGIEEFGVTRLANLIECADLAEVEKRLIKQFSEVFSAELYFEGVTENGET